MDSLLDRVIVHASCPTCGSRIGAPYIQVRSIGIFACGCGTVVDADMKTIAVQAVMGLAEEDGRVSASPR